MKSLSTFEIPKRDTCLGKSNARDSLLPRFFVHAIAIIRSPKEINKKTKNKTEKIKTNDKKKANRK